MPSAPVSRGRRRVLAVLTFDPWPVRSGTTRRLDAVIRSLAAISELTVFIVEADLSDEVPDLGGARVVKVRRDRSKLRSLASAARHGMTLRPVTAALHDRPEVRTRLEQELRRAAPELVFTHQIGGPELLRGLVPPWQVVLDADTVDPLSFRRVADDSRGLTKALWMVDSWLLTRWSRRVLPAMGAVSVVSPRDQDLFAALAPGARLLVVPNGVDLPAEARGGDPQGPLVFVGTMQYPPNRAAVDFLGRELMPLLPDVELEVVGPGAVPKHPRVLARGFVEDIAVVWNEASALVVPLRSGGGTRLKVLEAMAHGVPVVSTLLGVEGLPAEPGVHYLQAETPQEFAAMCRLVRADPDVRAQLSQAGRALSVGYAWDTCMEPLVAFVSSA